MPDNQYQFVSRWNVEGTCGEVADVLADLTALAQWWPAVYLSVEEVGAPNPQGLGQRVKVLTKGWLPYTLRWQAQVVESQYPRGLTIVAEGDFDGRGVWRFEQKDRFVDITYDWQLRAEKPLLRHLSFLLRPLFEANHRWAMAQGEASLKLELARRRATTDGERAQVAPPPGPVTYTGVAVLAGAAAVGASLAYLMFRSRGRRSRGRSG